MTCGVHRGAYCAYKHERTVEKMSKNMIIKDTWFIWPTTLSDSRPEHGHFVNAMSRLQP